MTSEARPSSSDLDRRFKSAARASGPSRRGKRTIPPVTLRLTVEERVKLEELAAGMTLSAYIRACIFETEHTRIKLRPKSVAADKQALAQVLGLLGQSRIANNLNQLAYHANVGSLVIDDAARQQIEESYDHVLLIRATLLEALGVSQRKAFGCETAASHLRRNRFRRTRTRSHQDHSEMSE